MGKAGIRRGGYFGETEAFSLPFFPFFFLNGPLLCVRRRRGRPKKYQAIIPMSSYQGKGRVVEIGNNAMTEGK
jgi:hypothetical protein